MLATAGAKRREALGRCDRGGARPGRGRQLRRRRRLQPGGAARRDRGRRVSTDPDEEAGVVEVWNVTRRSLVMSLRPDLAPDVHRLRARLQPGRPGARDGGSATGSFTSGTSSTGKLLRELEQNVGGVHSLEFSPDGRTFAVSGFGEPYASLWDVATGAQIGPRLTAGRASTMIDLSPDGRPCCRCTATARGPSGTSTRSPGRAARARSPTAR